MAGGAGRSSSGSSAQQAVARAPTPTRSSRSAPRVRRASSPATPTTPRCSTSRPHDIGIKVGDSQFAVVVPRNSMLPVRARRLFATTDDEPEVRDDRALPGRVDRRRRRTASSARSCSTTCRPARRARSRVELVITVDVESILGVTAREIKTGQGDQRHDPAVRRPVAARDRRDHQPAAPGDARSLGVPPTDGRRRRARHDPRAGR